MSLKRFCSILLYFLTAASCSVKENRDVCPCHLVLDVSEVDPSRIQSAELCVSQKEETVWKDTLVYGAVGDSYFAAVPRAELHVSVWSVIDGFSFDDGLEIPLGDDCPEIYMYDSDIRCYGEEVVEKVVMRKNYCVMTIMTEQETRFPHQMKIVSNVSGYDTEGRPLSGTFEYLLNENRYDDGWKVILPRQKDDSLALIIDDGKGTVKSFSLGHYIVSSGFDWNSPDLEDVVVALDYALTEVTIRLEGWDSVFTYKVEI